MSYTEIRVEIADGVSTITLSRPERLILTPNPRQRPRTDKLRPALLVARSMEVCRAVV